MSNNLLTEVEEALVLTEQQATDLLIDSQTELVVVAEADSPSDLLLETSIEVLLTPDVSASSELVSETITEAILASDVAVTSSVVPLAHAPSHSEGGSDEIDAADLGSTSAGGAGEVLTADGAGGTDWAAIVSGDELVSVTAVDTTPGYLNSKVVAGTYIDTAVLNPAGDEDLEIDVDIATLEAALDHDSLGGLPGADAHTQYLRLAGRFGGQSAFGGTLGPDDLDLAASPIPGTGRINVNSPMVFGAYEPTGAAYGFSYTAVESFPSGFIGGGLNFSGTITFTNALFIYESFRGSPVIHTAVTPGFAAYTVLQALPQMHAGSGAGHNPLNPLILNAGPGLYNGFSGARTSGNCGAVNWSPAIRPTVSGAVMNVTNMTGFINSPKFSTVAGSTANFGTVRGLWAQTPAQALFGSSAGSEIMTAYYALDVDNIGAFDGTAPVAAVRSAITNASGQNFLLNTGGADSAFGAGDALFNDSAGVMLGTGADVLLNWNGSALEFDPAIAAPDLRWTPSTLDYWRLDGSAALSGIQFDLDTITFGTTAADPSSSNFFVQFAAPNGRVPTVAGEYSDVHWTAGGSIDINGLAMSNVQAFKINSPAALLSGGSITDFYNLFVEAMPSIGTRQGSLRVTGRSRLDGLLNFNEATLATLTASVAALALPANNNGRFILEIDADALGPWTIQGIVNSNPGDSFVLVNVGANAFLLGHQDGAAAAADRIISPTGASLTLGQYESALMWYSPTQTRWIILPTTGA